jgi:hypothetical protein
LKHYGAAVACLWATAAAPLVALAPAREAPRVSASLQGSAPAPDAPKARPATASASPKPPATSRPPARTAAADEEDETGAGRAKRLAHEIERLQSASQALGEMEDPAPESLCEGCTLALDAAERSAASAALTRNLDVLRALEQRVTASVSAGDDARALALYEADYPRLRKDMLTSLSARALLFLGRNGYLDRATRRRPLHDASIVQPGTRERHEGPASTDQEGTP